MQRVLHNSQSIIAYVTFQTFRLTPNIVYITFHSRLLLDLVVQRLLHKSRSVWNSIYIPKDLPNSQPRQVQAYYQKQDTGGRACVAEGGSYTLNPWVNDQIVPHSNGKWRPYYSGQQYELFINPFCPIMDGKVSQYPPPQNKKQNKKKPHILSDPTQSTFHSSHSSQVSRLFCCVIWLA